MTDEQVLPGEEQEITAAATQTEEEEEETDTQLPPQAPPFPPPFIGDRAQDENSQPAALPPSPPPLPEIRKEYFPFAQRIDVDDPDTVEWVTDDWELPFGSMKGGTGDQVTARSPGSFPTPARVYLRGISCWENGYR